MSRFDFIHTDYNKNKLGRKRQIILILTVVAVLLQVVIEFHLWPVAVAPDAQYADLTGQPAIDPSAAPSLPDDSPAIADPNAEPDNANTQNESSKSTFSGTPSQFTPIPGSVPGVPGKVATPSKVQGTPGKVAGTPGKVQGTPGKVQGTPGKVQGTPGKVAGVPGKVPGTPGKVTPTPGKMEGIPGKMEGIPGKMKGIPGKVQGTPGKVSGTPGKMAGIPGKVQGTPGKDNRLGRKIATQEILLGLLALNSPQCKYPLTPQQTEKLLKLVKELNTAYTDVRGSTHIFHETLTREQFTWLEKHPDPTKHNDTNVPPELGAYEAARAALKTLK